MKSDSLQQAFLEVMHRFKSTNLFSVMGRLTKGEFFMLEMLVRHRASHPQASGMYVSNLAEKLEVSVPAVSRMLRGLEGGGLIERSVDLADRRNTFIQVTDAGEQAWHAAMQRMRHIMDRVVLDMGEQDMRTLLALAGRLTDALRREIQSEMDREGKQMEGETEWPRC